MKISRWCFGMVCTVGMALNACTGQSDGKDLDKEGISVVLLDNDQEDVSTMLLKKQKFYHELISNGKVAARKIAELRFETNEIVAKVYVKNGDRVQKGQKLAELDKFKLQNSLKQAEIALERAKLDLQDVLIGQGYTIDRLNEVPESIMKLAKVKSGYDQSLAQYELAKRAESQATLKAPFDGIVANLFTKPYNFANTAEPFCSILATNEIETDFMVLESELSLIKEGDRVIVTPYADSSVRYEGRVVEINPLVDSNGMVKVKALVKNKGGLFSGMNVRVSVRRTLSEQLVIPKTAVVLRSGRQVVFTLKNGMAVWNYVQTGLENADSCVVSNRADEGVTDGLVEGDSVIVSGNVNLANNTPVKLAQ